MQFRFTDDQLAFRDVVREVLLKECPPDVVRAAWADDPPDDGLWDSLAEIGVLGVTVPEEHGGLDLTWLELVLLLEETGRVALPHPIVETQGVVTPLLVAAERVDVGGWLSGIAAGAVVATAVVPPLVPYATAAHRADLFVVVEDDRVVAHRREEVDLVAQASMDGSRHLGRVVPHGSGRTLAEGPAARPLAEAALGGYALGVSAQMLGLAAHMLDMAGAYARERVQFGVPIGSFQAVKHHLSNGLLRLEIARPVVYRAAHSLATGSPHARRDVSMAKVYASEAADLAARVALQVHGAIGYTFEYDLQLFMKRAWSLAATAGDATWHREQVARAVLDA